MDPMKKKAMKDALQSMIADMDHEEKSEFKKDAGLAIEVKTMAEPAPKVEAVPTPSAMDRYKKLFREDGESALKSYRVAEAEKDPVEKLKDAQKKIETGAKKMGEDAKATMDQLETMIKENGFNPELLTEEERKNLADFIKKAKGQKPDAGM